MTLRRMTERAKVAVGPAPHGHIAYAGSLDQVWVLNSGARDISVLDGTTGRLERTIDVGGSPRHVIFDDGAALAFVAADDALVVVDARDERLTNRLSLAAGTRGTCLLPMLPRQRMYVLGDAGAMTVVDTARQAIVGTIETGRGSSWGQPHEKTCGKLYVANGASDDLTIVDEGTEQVITTVKVGRHPVRNAIFRERGLVYTANAADGTVTAVSIATDAVVATIATGPVPFRLIGMEKKTGRPDLWVLDRADAHGKGAITVIGATEHRVTGSIDVMDRPSNWLFEGPIAHVAGTGARELVIIDATSSTIVGSSALTEEPDSASFSNMVFSRSGNLFLANASDSVSVLAAGS